MLHETSQPHDATALLDYTRKKNLFIGGVEYLAGMVEDPLAIAADDEAVLAAAHRLKEYAGFRALMATLQASVRMCESGESSLDGVLSFLEDAVQSTRKTVHTNRTGPRQMKEIIETVMVGMERQMDGEVTPATSTGFDDLDQICYGLQDEDFIVFGARPSMGKTASAINIAENVSDTGEKVLFFSLEMRDVALGIRALARKSRVSLSSIIKAEVNNDDWSRLSDGIHQLHGSNVWIDDSPGLTIHDIRARARAFFAKHGKARIIVDYLQYVSPSRPGDTREHVKEVSRGLKNLARELKTSVIALSQLSRKLEERANKRPIMSDLRESGDIEQDADQIWFLYRDEVYHPETKEPGIAEVIVGKNRNGPTGVAKLGYTAATSSFFNLGTAY